MTIAEDMIDGCCCALCGQYFANPDESNSIYAHGYPVACSDCWTKDCGYEQSLTNTL